MRFNKTSLIKFFICILIIADIDFSYRQHEHKPIDGDLAVIVAPSSHYTTILQEPFGSKAVFQHVKYAATNRYFSHAAMVFYYKKLYHIFSPFVENKVKFIYVFTGIYQTLIQLIVVLLLCVYALRNINIKSMSFLLLFLFLSAFMQTHGYYGSIGIIDQSVTYTFFYAMPLCLLMLLLLPFLFFNVENKSSIFKTIFFIIWICLAFIVSMTGPVIAPVGIIISTTILLKLFIKNYQSTPEISFFQKVKSSIQKLPLLKTSCLLLFILFCLYSQYVGTFNIENGEPTTLSFRYGRLLVGLAIYFTYDASFLLIAIILFVNFFILKKSNKQILSELKLILILAAIYICLLPLGGYRPYRPNIIRYDTFMPITIALFYLIGRTTFLTAKSIKNKLVYFGFLSIIFIIFMYADKPQFTDNDCQYERILELKNTINKDIVFDDKCTLMNWAPVSDTNSTMAVSRMLYYWQITDTIKPYSYK